MPSSVETLVQTDLQAILQAIGLAGFATASVGLIREQPKIGEVLDFPLPAVLICPHSAPPPEGMSFEGSVSRTYVEEIIVVFGREGDGSSDQPATQLAYAECYNAVERNSDGSWRVKLPTATTVYDLRVSNELAGV